jgi:hypothetical protein
MNRVEPAQRIAHRRLGFLDARLALRLTVFLTRRAAHTQLLASRTRGFESKGGKGKKRRGERKSRG